MLVGAIFFIPAWYIGLMIRLIPSIHVGRRVLPPGAEEEIRTPSLHAGKYRDGRTIVIFLPAASKRYRNREIIISPIAEKNASLSRRWPGISGLVMKYSKGDMGFREFIKQLDELVALRCIMEGERITQGKYLECENPVCQAVYHEECVEGNKCLLCGAFLKLKEIKGDSG